MKKSIISVCLVVALVFSMTTAFALAEESSAPVAYGSGIPIENYRGDNPSTANTKLLYTGSGTIYSSVYSNYKFKPNSNGTITGSFTGSISSGTASVTLYLYDCDAGKIVKTSSIGTASAWTNYQVTCLV